MERKHFRKFPPLNFNDFQRGGSRAIILVSLQRRLFILFRNLLQHPVSLHLHRVFQFVMCSISWRIRGRNSNISLVFLLKITYFCQRQGRELKRNTGARPELCRINVITDPSRSSIRRSQCNSRFRNFTDARMEEFAILMNGGSRDRDERATINHRPGDRTFEDRHSSRTGRHRYLLF